MFHTKYRIFFFWISIKWYVFVLCIFGIVWDRYLLGPGRNTPIFSFKLGFQQGNLEILFTHLRNLTPRALKTFDHETGPIYSHQVGFGSCFIYFLCFTWIRSLSTELLGIEEGSRSFHTSPALRSPQWVWAVHSTSRIAMARCHEMFSVIAPMENH